MKVKDFQNKTLTDRVTDIIYANDYDFTDGVPTSVGRDYFIDCCIENINDHIGDMSDIAAEYDLTQDDVDAIVAEIANNSANFVFSDS